MTAGKHTATRAATGVLLGVTGLIAWGAAALAASSYTIPLPPALSAEQQAALAPGLAVQYVQGNYRFVYETRRVLDSTNQHIYDGAPVPALAYEDLGNGNRVLTSDKANLIAAKITGYIKFPEPGTYEISVWSNDGVLVDVNGVEVYEDPDRHVCRSLDFFTLNVPEAGYYPLKVYYFQRYVTYCLELMWTRPSGGGDVQVPPEFFAHDPVATH